MDADGEIQAAVLLWKPMKGELFAFAALWDRWKDPSGQWVKPCSILTTTPNGVTAAVHDRMPVIPDPDGYDVWLDPGMKDVAAASDLLTLRCPADEMLFISTRVTNVANDDAECSKPWSLSRFRVGYSHSIMTSD
jgi:putative SOS response-associated peptidase YedK